MVGGEAERFSRLAGVIVAACGIAAVAVAVSMAVPHAAVALPTYSEKEHKPCDFCHVNPAGDGALNAVGKKYVANGHTFPK